ncbi:tRNA pseudouridine(13) synthase TruD [Methanoplanus sp. FWC-SCC4]|uniref:Probable tRNA pseudouridine synthase D n=1 Tax=Methanochimaera problematica TaxID=2609417 RepID=A0AA97FEC2_9EURY|nr:tRNA pseudouridine(13) synthase TruD [Methanoplanus sp. FWC-SCC4]WOF16493.1 tRNA pseudouridine(13) synthase TruD [Methanoplanus sp. FWC-SCC4]
MMKSPYKNEQILGMEYYITDTPGTGGHLRETPEDFRVGELFRDVKLTGGPHLICELEKTNWELQRAVKEITKRLGISHKRIGWGGTKDKRAVTTQLISIYGIKAEDLEDFHLKDINLKPLGYANSQLSLGDLEGNNFDIWIRDCDGPDIAGNLESCVKTAQTGLPNYYGIQRFGVTRPVSHLVGIEMLKGNYKEAVFRYVGFPCDDEHEETKTARQAFEDNQDPKETLSLMPVYLRYERAMLHHLVEQPEDYKGALMVIPPKLLSMFVSAYQSYLFNRVLSKRIENSDNISEPETGDRLIFPDGKEDIVTEKNIRTAKVHMKRGRCSLSIYMPGSEDYEIIGEMDRYAKEIMEETGITKKGFSEVTELVGARFKGASRAISMRTEIDYKISENNINLKFTLPPGHYATTVCREIMKADPKNMI